MQRYSKYDLNKTYPVVAAGVWNSPLSMQSIGMFPTQAGHLLPCPQCDYLSQALELPVHADSSSLLIYVRDVVLLLEPCSLKGS